MPDERGLWKGDFFAQNIWRTGCRSFSPLTLSRSRARIPIDSRNRFDPGRHQRCAAPRSLGSSHAGVSLDYRALLAVASVTASDSVGHPLLDFVQLVNNVPYPVSVTHTLETCSGSIWPLQPGSPIRRDGDLICVDLYAATARLSSLLEFPSVQGKVANARAAHFELAAQAVIDDSPWCPNNDLKQLRGRKLRYNNQDVTDIDAIGEYNGTLLMVSCKSVIYTSAYDSGDYALVRNRSEMIEEAVRYWTDKKMFLEAHKLGLNYDFTRYEHFIAVVCTPWPVYVSLGPATREITPRLLASVSLAEFQEWLRLN